MVSINEVATANDACFSYDKKKVHAGDAYTWIRLEIPMDSDKTESVIYLTNEYLQIHTAYLWSEGKPKELPVGNYQIYPHIELPKDTMESNHLYLKVGDLHTNYKMVLKLIEKQEFYHSQNILFLYRGFAITFLITICIINFILYYFHRKKVYFMHAILLFVMAYALIQDSGIQKLIIGFNDSEAAYIWGFMTSMMAMYANYMYLGVKDLSRRLIKAYRILILLHLIPIIMVNLVRISIFSQLIYLFLTVICFIGLILSIYASKNNTQKIPGYFLAVVFLTYVGTASYILGIFGIVSWNIFTANSIYILWALEAFMFTFVIITKVSEENKQMEQLKTEAVTDVLTGLFNRNYFEKEVVRKVSEMDNMQKSTCLLMIDIDFFKNVNDTFGHNVGDILLKELSGLLTCTVWEQNDVIRWGGEEFIVLMYNISLREAIEYAEKIRKTIEEHYFHTVGKITVSIGVAEKERDEKIQPWLKRADDALYKAKNDGRNRIY